MTYVSGATDIDLDRVAPANVAAPVVTGLVTIRARRVNFVRATDAVDAYITLPDNDGFYVIRVVQVDAAGNTATSPNTTVQLARGTRGTGGEDTTPTPPTDGGGGNTTTTTTTTTTVNVNGGRLLRDQRHDSFRGRFARCPGPHVLRRLPAIVAAPGQERVGQHRRMIDPRHVA